jgi:SAM-dependent methyltransferase
MQHADHVNLLRQGIPPARGTAAENTAAEYSWADFGSGSGAFTLALAELIQTGSTIFSIERDRSALQAQEEQMKRRFPGVPVQYLKADYTHRLALPPLDGIIAANTLHFQPDPLPVLKLFFSYLKPTGRMILVEYNIDKGNYAVPYPLPYSTWERFAQQAGFAKTQLLATRPSHFLKEIYSALSIK